MMAAKSAKPLREISVSEFKAKCLSLLEEVNKTKTPLRVVKRGKPLAEVMPPSPDESQSRENWVGSLSDSTRVLGDIISPVIDIEDIEAMKD